MTGDRQDLINYRISRAKDTLTEAEVMISNKFWNAAISRIYYACYYAVSSLLLSNSIKTKTHKGLRNQFALHFVQPGIISKDLGRFYSDLYDKRQTGDYDDYIIYTEEAVIDAYQNAKELISKIEELLLIQNQ